MTRVYRGITLDAHRAKSLGGDALLYWSYFRGNRELDSGFSTGSDRVQTFLKYMKERVDAEISDGNKEWA